MKESMADKIIAGFLGVLLVGIVGMVMGTYSIWAYAYVGNILWGWFMVPVFGLPALTLAKAFGISTLLRMWTFQWTPWKGKDERTDQAKFMELLGLITSPWWFLLLGWIAKIWMG